MGNTIQVQDITEGIAQAVALRKRYQEEGFGLETGFERRDCAEHRIAKLKQIYGLATSDTRLVKHVSSPETGRRTTWEVYIRDSKGVEVLFP